ncbi:DUF2357 domain-containing protein [Atopomonas sediminilitoris]|uniref:DUF2357 domain-containing protein n=1 Tax=Atopomonas sediminilitoris TaxID=2919919 RepID=UPI001F4D9DB5|nr:DUF2357 domain-containing protein [Atopomonas sediminilitoris]MCJ8168433.1 DUF2357 domain-containing protein [Atopomonas sediminilitoris]
MLSIRIVSGERKDKEIILPTISEPSPSKLAIREDEALHFKVTLDEYFENLNLVLHEIETPYTHCKKSEGAWIYEWLPKEKYGYKQCFFHNYYGLAELQLVAREPNHSQSSTDFTFFAELQPIEVFAKKINAERVEKMLNFLARQDGKDLASAIRVTRIRAGYKEGGRTENFLLERIENNITFLKKVLPSISHNPISRLQQSTKIVTPTHDTLIDEVALSWASENPDNLTKAFSIDEAVLAYAGEYYSTNKILESTTINSTDVYENQVLHGFVFTLITAIQSIKSKLSKSNNQGSAPPTEFTGYVSLFTQINKFSAIINKRKIDTCTRLIRDLSQILAQLKISIPVSKPCTDMPRFTQKSKFNILYRQIFSRSIAWRRYGAPDWSFQEELFSIQSIPKLFEYYLLCAVKHHIQIDHSTPPFAAEETTSDTDVFEYKSPHGQIRLMYEPNIWTVGHSSVTKDSLVNTEGWTVNNQDKAPKISKRGTIGWRANRCPDILIEVISNTNKSDFIIIDAKYTDSNRAFLTYLPELTMKYIHGIHTQDSGAVPSRALLIVNPSEIPATRHFHHHDYSIYGKTPANPALLVSSIDVSCSHEPDSNLRRDLAQIIKIIEQTSS